MPQEIVKNKKVYKHRVKCIHVWIKGLFKTIRFSCIYFSRHQNLISFDKLPCIFFVCVYGHILQSTYTYIPQSKSLGTLFVITIFSLLICVCSTPLWLHSIFFRYIFFFFIANKIHEKVKWKNRIITKRNKIVSIIFDIALVV